MRACMCPHTTSNVGFSGTASNYLIFLQVYMNTSSLDVILFRTFSFELGEILTESLESSQGNGPIRHVETCPDFFSLQEYTQQNLLSKF
jgi:hypothetical protein